MFEQPGFLRLILRLGEGPGVLRFLQVNQLLAQCAAAGMLRIAIANRRHAATETEKDCEGHRGIKKWFLHVGRCYSSAPRLVECEKRAKLAPGQKQK